MEITDDVCFKDGPGTLSEHLVSYNRITVQDKALIVHGSHAMLKVDCSGCQTPVVEHLEAVVDGHDVYRARFVTEKALSSKITFTFYTE